MGLDFKQHQLPNGLQIIAESNPDAHSLALGFYVNTGSRDEPPEINGVSHFLEHMMFKGSAHQTWEDVNRIFDEMGARPNAYTSQENTAYTANVLPEFTRRTIEQLALLLRPAIRHEDFDTEKKVILQEIAMYADDPGQRLYEVVMETHFGDHPLSQSVIGSVASVQQLTRAQMAAYHGERYGPGNTILAAAGKMSFDELIELAERFCGDRKPASIGRQCTEPRYQSQRRDLTDPKLNRHYMMALMPGPGAQNPRRFAARVLADVIGDVDGSRLYWALVDNALTEEADFAFYPHDQSGSFFLSLMTDPDRADQALDIALKELQRIRSDLTDAEVQRAKNKIGSSIVLEGELPMGRLSAIAGQWLYNHDYRSLEQDIAMLDSVSANSLRTLMEEFPFDPMTIVSLGPGK